eukprot:14198785-Heterocapsa_arctica.AAC.1
MGARKLAAGVLTANHSPVRFEGRNWFCKVCGIFGYRPADMGKDCTGPPEKGTTRYCKSRRDNLTRYALGLNLGRGRNKDRKLMEVDGPE